MFHLEKHRHQLIIEVSLSDEALDKYRESKKTNPQAVFTLKTKDDLALAELVAKKSSFIAIIESKSNGEYVTPNPPSVMIEFALIKPQDRRRRRRCLC